MTLNESEGAGRTLLAMPEEPRAKRGRPPKPIEELGKRINIYVAPDVEEWLRAQPEGMSKAIAKLVRQARHNS